MNVYVTVKIPRSEVEGYIQGYAEFNDGRILSDKEVKDCFVEDIFANRNEYFYSDMTGLKVEIEEGE